MALRFAEELAAEQRVDCELAPEALSLLMQQPWPGQIRELQATVKATAVRCWWRAHGAAGSERRRVVVGASDLQSYLAERRNAFGSPAPSGSAISVPLPESDPRAPLREQAPQRKRPADLTREDLEAALRDAGGNKVRAAQALGISRTTLRKKMDELGVG